MTDNSMHIQFPALIDLHMHTTVSDGSDTPQEILEHVRETGLNLFAVTDHDAVKGCRIIREALQAGDPLYLTGAEFSCKDEEGKYHILGYGFDPDSRSISDLVGLGHGLRMKKVRARIEFLREKFGFTFSQQELDELYAMDNPGKPHIGNMMVRRGYAPDRNVAIKDYINKLRMGNEYVRPEQAITAILGGGGIPVLAHPAYGDGDQIILGEEMEQRLRRLMDFGLQGLEAFYSGFTAKLCGQMLAMAQKYDLYITAGSDYHGRNKLVILGDTGLEDTSEWPEGLGRFLEDVSDRCVMHRE